MVLCVRISCNGCVYKCVFFFKFYSILIGTNRPAPIIIIITFRMNGAPVFLYIFSDNAIFLRFFLLSFFLFSLTPSLSPSRSLFFLVFFFSLDSCDWTVHGIHAPRAIADLKFAMTQTKQTNESTVCVRPATSGHIEWRLYL